MVVGRGLVGVGVAVTVAVAACGGDPAASDARAIDGAGMDAGGYAPGSPQLLSVGSADRDEDPFVLGSRDGSIYVAWFTEQSGGGDIVVRRTTDGASWSPLAQISATPDVDFYPSLFEDAATGEVHAVWFRRVGGPGGRGHIVYNHTADGLSWAQATEVAVTAPTGADNDWTPSIVRTAAGRLVIAFARDACFPQPQPCFALWVTSSADGVTWTAPTAMVDATGVQDHLPYLARAGASVRAVWNRYDTGSTLPYTSPLSDVAVATSDDGAVWTTPVEITSNDAMGVYDLFPMLYDDHVGTERVLWLRADGFAITVVDRAVAGVGAAAPVPPLPGAAYSHRVTATATPGVYLAAWVQGTGVALDIYTQVFTR